MGLHPHRNQLSQQNQLIRASLYYQAEESLALARRAAEAGVQPVDILRDEKELHAIQVVGGLDRVATDSGAEAFEPGQRVAYQERGWGSEPRWCVRCPGCA